MINFQTNTDIRPANIPDNAPSFVILFQKSEKIIRGPNVAPKPAQANDTTVNITLFLS